MNNNIFIRDAPAFLFLLSLVKKGMKNFSMDDFKTLHELGFFSHLDYYFSTTMAGIFKETMPLDMLLAASTSRALSEGHVCFNPVKAAGSPLQLSDGRVVAYFPDAATLINTLTESTMVGKKADHNPGNIDDTWFCHYPLILDQDGNLYLTRYYDFQNRLACTIRNRVDMQIQGPDDGFIAAGLAPFFKSQKLQHTHDQQQAVKKALSTGFTIISGGPGTGKTYVTDIIQKILTQWADACGLPPVKVLCLAPTGKAASRLKNGVTIHGALKPLHNGTGFVHNAGHPLDADLVIIDEASMIDMALMVRLMEAITLDTRVVMLGDKNQLSPVQAGSVFADFCQAECLKDNRVFLTFNFRSAGHSGIEMLADAVNAGDVDTVENILTGNEFPDLIFENSDRPKPYQSRLESYIYNGYTPLFSSKTVAQALSAVDRFRVLCAHNSGPGGTLQINHLCENILRSRGRNDINASIFKTLLMVRRNDYNRLLFNGDTCVLLEQDGVTTAWFESETKEIRSFRPVDLPDSEQAFAVTIHKSQGSEFDTVLILIPEQISPVVTRQLLYTGITRSREKVIIFGSLPLIRQALNTPVARRSNLLAALGQAV